MLKDDDVYAGLLHEVPGHLVPGLHRLHIRHLARHSFPSSISLRILLKRFRMFFPFTGAKTKIHETVTFPAPLNGNYEQITNRFESWSFFNLCYIVLCTNDTYCSRMVKQSARKWSTSGKEQYYEILASVFS